MGKMCFFSVCGACVSVKVEGCVRRVFGVSLLDCRVEAFGDSFCY